MLPENRDVYDTFVYECVKNTLTHDNVALSQSILRSHGSSERIILPMLLASINYRSTRVFEHYLAELMKAGYPSTTNMVTILAEVLRSTLDVYLAFKRVVGDKHFASILDEIGVNLTNSVAYSYYRSMIGDSLLYDEVVADIPFNADDFARVGLSEAIACDDLKFIDDAITLGCDHVPACVVISNLALRTLPPREQCNHRIREVIAN
jgi:hypothetical protein